MNSGNNGLNLLRNERGQAMALAGIFIVPLLVFGVVAVNVGYQSYVANETQLLADAAAAAAAQAAIQATVVLANGAGDPTGAMAAQVAVTAIADANHVDGKPATGEVGTTTDCTPNADADHNACVVVQTGYYNGTYFASPGSLINAAQANAFAQSPDIIPLPGFLSSPALIHKTATAAFTSIKRAPLTFPLALGFGGCDGVSTFADNICCSPDCPNQTWSVGCSPPFPVNPETPNFGNPVPTYQLHARWTAGPKSSPSQANILSVLPSCDPELGAGPPPVPVMLEAGQPTQTVGTWSYALGPVGDAEYAELLDRLSCLFENGPWTFSATNFIVPVVDLNDTLTGSPNNQGCSNITFPHELDLTDYHVVGFTTMMVTGICSPHGGCVGNDCAFGCSDGLGVVGGFVPNITAPYTPGGKMISMGEIGLGKTGTELADVGDFGTGYVILVSDTQPTPIR